MKNEFDGLIEYLLSNHILLPEAIALLEQRMIEGALSRSEHNQSKASEQLGIHRNTMQRKMVEFGIGNGRTRPRRKQAASAGRTRKRRTSAA
jgi:Fis family transcriptional regulator, factor for inversion stimulation protein